MCGKLLHSCQYVGNYDITVAGSNIGVVYHGIFGSVLQSFFGKTISVVILTFESEK